MIVTVVCDVLGSENNGTTIAAMNLIRSLRAKGHTVRVVCPDESRRGEKDCYIVPAYNLGTWLNAYVAKNGVMLAKPDRDVIEQAIDGADVVHVMIPFAVGGCAARIAYKKGIALTAGFHCQAENVTNHLFMMNMSAANHTAYRIFRKNLYRYCDCVHYPTQFICDLFEKETGPTNHYVISNGVSSSFVRREVSRPAELNGKFVILFTGRYSKEKSHKVLIDGVARSKHRDDIQLIFAGAGPQGDNIAAYASEQAISTPIMKFYNRDELIDVINTADLYVHPAQIEIEAISCLEAIKCGVVPVICDSPRSATRYFALGENNLFRCNDAGDLAEKIDYWIEHPDERKKCSNDYEGYAARFDFDLCMDKMEQMLLDAVKMHEKG